jgi:hypothetical protein
MPHNIGSLNGCAGAHERVCLDRAGGTEERRLPRTGGQGRGTAPAGNGAGRPGREPAPAAQRPSPGRRLPGLRHPSPCLIAPGRRRGNAPEISQSAPFRPSVLAGVLDILKATSPTGGTESDPYLDDVVVAPACDGAPCAGMCRHTSFGFGKNARWAHSARRRARRCEEVRCSLGTVTVIFPLLTVLMALRASGVQ